MSFYSYAVMCITLTVRRAYTFSFIIPIAFQCFMMCEIKNTFISSIFAQFRIIHVLDAWGMFAQACAVMPHPLCRRISCIGAYNIMHST